MKAGLGMAAGVVGAFVGTPAEVKIVKYNFPPDFIKRFQNL